MNKPELSREEILEKTRNQLRDEFIRSWAENLINKIYVPASERDRFHELFFEEIMHLMTVHPYYEHARSALVMTLSHDADEYDYIEEFDPSLFSKEKLLDCFKEVQKLLGQYHNWKDKVSKSKKKNRDPNPLYPYAREEFYSEVSRALIPYPDRRDESVFGSYPDSSNYEADLKDAMDSYKSLLRALSSKDCKELYLADLARKALFWLYDRRSQRWQKLIDLAEHADVDPRKFIQPILMMAANITAESEFAKEFPDG